MNVKKINHVGIVVSDLSQAIPQYRDILGLKYSHTEHNDDFDCDIAMFECGDVLIELVEPHGPSVSKTFLEEKGEGVNHICYEVDDIEESIKEMHGEGYTAYSKALDGAGDSKVFFLNDNLLCSVTTEIVELKK